MGPLAIGLLAGGGLGLLKGRQDDIREKQDRKVAAETARWSPWTGMAPQPVQRSAGMMGGAMQGALAGGAFGQNLATASAYDKLLASQTPTVGEATVGTGVGEGPLSWMNMGGPAPRSNYVMR